MPKFVEGGSLGVGSWAIPNMARRVLAAVAVIITACVLLTMFAGCNKEKTPEEEFSSAKKEVVTISTTENFYCFKEFLKNVVLEDEEIDIEDLFIKIGRDDVITVHVLSSAKDYSVYTVESKQNWGIVNALTSEKGYIYLASHDDEGEEIFLQRPFNESVWNAWYDVEGDRIIFEP